MKKQLVFIVVIAMAFVSAYTPRALALQDALGCQLIKGPNSDAVYCATQGEKHVFPDLKTYRTWYDNFSAVATVPVSVLDNYPTGAPVSYRPGTKLITHANTARVYAVSPDSVLHLLPSEAIAEALYGSSWAKRVQDVHELTFAQYHIGNDATPSTPVPGTILADTQSGSLYYFTGTTDFRIIH